MKHIIINLSTKCGHQKVINIKIKKIYLLYLLKKRLILFIITNYISILNAIINYIYLLSY